MSKPYIMCKNHGKVFGIRNGRCNLCIQAHLAKGTKHCFRCKTDKLFSNFYVDNSRILGLSTYCKECTYKTVRASILNSPIRSPAKKSDESLKVIAWQKKHTKRVKYRLARKSWMANPENRKKHKEAKNRWNDTEYGQLYNQLYRLNYNINRRKGESKPLQELNYE